MTKRILLLAAVVGLGAIAQSSVYAQAAATPAPTPAAGEAASPAASPAEGAAKKGTSGKKHRSHKVSSRHHHRAAKKEGPMASPAASPSPAAQ
jgi:hypothetical protein